MKHLLNSLYITNAQSYLSLDGENVVVEQSGKTVGRVPFHNIDSIYVFGYMGASPALMGKCAEKNIALVFLKPNGQFLAKVTGKTYGNILLRKQQFHLCEDDAQKCCIAKNMIAAKIINSGKVLQRMIRDHSERIDVASFEKSYESLRKSATLAFEAASIDTLRGIEGASASVYFNRFDDMILRSKDAFYFKDRNRRPPLDNVNALLSFSYSMLTSMCVSALEMVGLDPYSGVFHTDRPGRCSLALDLVEEFRAPLADRFVLTLINKGIMTSKDFIRKENEGVLLNEDGRKKFIQQWQSKKQENLTHPFLKEKIEWGMLPYVQAMLLARYIRGDMDAYPAFIWK